MTMTEGATPSSASPPPSTTGDPSDLADHGAGRRLGWWPAIVGIGAWLLLVLVARAWALAIVRDQGFEALRLGAAPLVGRGDFLVAPMTLVGLAVGVAAVALAPHLVRLRWRALLVAVLVGAVVWPVAVNLSRGPEALTAPLTRAGDEYLPDVGEVDAAGGPRAFLQDFPERIDDYNVHVRSHPPGFLLLLWALDGLGLGGAGWAAALCILGGALAAPAVLVATRDVAGEQWARAAAPFVAVSPAALWVATTADALYAGVGAVGVTTLILASRRPGRTAAPFALAGGVLLGACALLSYGLGLLWLVPLPVLLHRRRPRVLVIALASAAAVVGVFALAGFDYLAAFEVTRREVAESVQRTRPYVFSLVSNAAALALAAGPAVIVGLVALRDRQVWRVVGGALAAVALAALVGLSKGEVERIWLAFTVWLLAAGGVAVRRWGPASLRWWLGAQVAVALVVQAVFRTGW
ncbi:MAG: hypothetical protein JNK12_04880 [Acidimicrobiales bacterium]|nr:hypothetical protein [Acidimicrobiales bacterium]